MSGFLNLPTELVCEIVRQWLCLKDVVQLDSAFCHAENRNALHESVFQSPLCILAIAHPYFSLVPAIFEWVSMKCIRLSTLHVRKGASFDNCEDYLKRFGSTVRSVAFRRSWGDSVSTVTLVVRYCTNLCDLAMFYCDLCLCVDILKSSTLLRSIDITSDPQSKHLVHWDSLATHLLQIASIKLHCSKCDEEVILGMCDPLCVERLRLANMTHIQWHTYVNLRSFGFYNSCRFHNDNVLTQICTLCPWIVNLEVYCPESLADAMVVSAIPALNQLRSFNCECSELTDDVLHLLIAHHKHTLEAVYLHRCDSISESAINRMLTECVNLHTMSCELQDDIDYSLMGNLTTLIMNFPSAEVWNEVQQHCRSLQCLHLRPPWITNNDFSCACDNLQALRTVYTTRAIVHRLRLLLTSFCVVGEEEGEWYDLFELPI